MLNKTKLALSLTLVLFGGAACAESPTGPHRGITGGPSFDGGWTAGSGNRAAPDSGAATVYDAGTTCADDGGWTAGSGNKGAPTCVAADGRAAGVAYDGGVTLGSGSGVPSAPQTATAQSDTTQRGGVLIGSGH